MLELAERAVREALAAGAEYAEARVVRSAAEFLRVRDGATVEAGAPTEFGLGVRALVNGAFGFAAVPGSPRELGDLTAGVARRAARGARELATTRRRRTVLAPATPHHVGGDGGGAHTPVAVDPFAVSLEDKLALLFELDAALAGGRDIQTRDAHLSVHRDERWVATLDALHSAYDLILLDCPPTINLLAENIFAAADIIVVPLVPTTLSLLAHHQLLDFLAANGYASRRVCAFFSMVDGRKKMHRDLIAQAREEHAHILDSAIPYLAPVEQMGVYRAPVGVFAATSPAAAAYAQLWQELSTAIAPASTHTER